MKFYITKKIVLTLLIFKNNRNLHLFNVNSKLYDQQI
jgi:hypothetical protein